MVELHTHVHIHRVSPATMGTIRALALLAALLVSSIAAQRNGDILLTEGYKGLLKVFYNGRYGYVCDDTASPGSVTTLGTVACRNINRSFVNAAAGTKGPTSSFMLDDTACVGTESNLDECKHKAWGSENCGASEHIYITCTDLPCDGGKSNCSQVCNNNGTTGYSCSCHPGYSLKSDRTTCRDVNECLVKNGGCSHTCVNTVGSHYCECPRYLYLSDDNSTCTADGFTVDCSSTDMKITMDKKTFFFLPDSLTLLNTSCTSTSNSTHVWLYTDYNACSTGRKIVDNEIIYSNAVLDSETSTGGIRFFDSIKIPFKCRLSANRTISQGLKPVANQLIMRVDGRGSLPGVLELLSGDSDDSPRLSPYYIRQGEVVYAKLIPSLNGIVTEAVNCTASSIDGAASQKLITNSQATNFLTTLLPSRYFRFSYPVFTFNEKNKTVNLSCDYAIRTNQSLENSVNQSLIISSQERDGGEKRVVDTNFCYGLEYSQQAEITVANKTVSVYCDVSTPGGPWITILRHTKNIGEFSTTFSIYESGFGNPSDDHFIGLKTLHELTARHNITLRVDLARRNGDEHVYAEYTNFKVGDASTYYTLQELSGYTGTAGDLKGVGPTGNPIGMKFSTYDRDNDLFSGSCADNHKGGWWFNRCFTACLTCEPMVYTMWGGDAPSSASLKVRVNKPASSAVGADEKDTIKPVVVDTTNGVSLHCGPKVMTLTLDPTVTVGLSLDDLQPLRQNCFGFASWIEGGDFKYTVPLTDCGAEVKTVDDAIVFTNSLVYSNNRTSKVKYFSEVIWTHSCSYSVKGYKSSLNYSVKSNNYTFGAENKKPANFDVSLNVFSDGTFKKLLNNGGTISINEGRQLFGDIGVKSSDPNLKVAMNDCKVTPTKNVDDPNSHLVIKNGCRTAYGTRVLSPDRFSLLTRSFVDHRGENVYLHCSVIVCDSNDLSRCTKRCKPSNENVIGKRDLDTTPVELVVVSAGPFLIL